MIDYMPYSNVFYISRVMQELIKEHNLSLEEVKRINSDIIRITGEINECKDEIVLLKQRVTNLEG